MVRALPWLVLLVGLPLVYAAWVDERAHAEVDQKLHFEIMVKEARDRILYQFALYEQSLYGVKNFYRASLFVDEEEFGLYAGAVLQQHQHQGMEYISFVKYMDTRAPHTYQAYLDNVSAFTEQHYGKPVVGEIAPTWYVVPANASPKYVDQLHVQPAKDWLLESTNAYAIGLYMEMQSNPQLLGHKRFVMHLPIPDEGAMQSGSPTGPAIIGWVTATVDANAFFTSALSPIDNALLAYTVHSGNSVEPGWQVHDSLQRKHDVHYAPSRFKKRLLLEVLGHEWLLTVHSLPSFDADVDYSQADSLGFLGLLACLALACILYFMAERIRTLGVMQDVSKRLTLSEQRWQFALEGSGDGLMDWDLQTNQVLFSKRWKAMLGYEEHEIGNHPDEWKLRIHPEDYVTVMTALERALASQDQTYTAELRLKCKDDTWKWILARGMVVSRDTQRKPLRLVGTQTDISNLKESEEAVWQHANFDLLTNLPNRRNFYNQAEKELNKSRRSGLKVALLFLDLDKFKEVNDTQGHDQGDYLLQLTANRLKESMRSSDAVFRLGGDEFVIVIGGLTATELDNLDVVAQKVLHLLAQPYHLAYEVAYISASIGIAVYPDDASNIDNLMKCVDQAMYASKQRGGNCFSYFTQHMQEVAQNRRQLSNDLRMALPRNELLVEYQPIINLSTMQVCKAEALIRWQHPTRGLISPAVFIPIAEDTRLIQEIGHWVFVQATQQATIWRKKLHKQFQIAVNKSPIQFNSDAANAVDWVNILEQSQLPGDLIVVEITERLILDGNDHVKQRLHAFHEAGIQVALDDFGTGYSSLSYLKKFEIDYIKIDRSFVANLSEGSSDLALCEAMIVMAHRLGMQVVAEGIETSDQLALLKRAGCDFGQGYYFAKSLSPGQFEQYVREHLTPSKA